MKTRIILIFSLFMILWSALVLRAGYLQFIPGDRLKALKARQFETVVTLPPRRGAILDREGRDLAMSATVYSLYADPKIIEDKKRASKLVSKVLGQSNASVYSKIKDPKRRFVWLERMLEREKAEEIRSLGIKGLALVEEWKRVYPNESLLSQTMGFVGSEGQGLEGIEKKYDNQLKGNIKKVAVRRDARGRPLVNNGLMFTETPDGDDIQLTIDTEIQYALESELQGAVQEFEADSAVGIILDARTSEILALASAPLFDLNKAKTTLPQYRRNRPVTDAFEPGSTLKTFVIASALREGLVQPNTKFFCENGSMKIGKRTIREAESHEKFGNLSVTEILAVSSNVGTTKIAFQLGADKYRKGLVDFGFGARSGVDLPGEARGILHNLPWRQHLLSNISFGHGISGTPLQVANAYAAIANGGVLNTPYIVSSRKNGETGETERFSPKPIRRVLTPEQAQQMRMILTAATGKGSTGTNARVEGYLVGGKTGTAQKVNPSGRGYVDGAYISSFAGFIPANDPRFVIYVAVDSPRKSYYGSKVAAPIFSRLASFAVRKAGIAPQILPARSMHDPVLAKQSSPKKIEVVTGPLENASGLVPDLKGLTTREVLRHFIGQDIKVELKGTGRVSETYPAAGSDLPESRKIEVILN